MQDRISFICDKEGVTLDADAFDLLAQVWWSVRSGAGDASTCEGTRGRQQRSCWRRRQRWSARVPLLHSPTHALHAHTRCLVATCARR
jgi:hypothetical protein